MKFFGKRILKIKAEPVAISIYPLKSKYIWNVKHIVTSQLSKKLKSNYTHVTSGEHGSTIYNYTTNEILRCPAFASKVVDKVGTGDSMLAILAISLYKKIDVKFSMLLSALVAAHNIQDMANKKPYNKTYITKAVQSYLK